MKKPTYKISKEEYESLDMDAKIVFNILENSYPIDILLNDAYDDLNVIINFKVTQINERTYFQFDIADGLEPIILWNVKGSIMSYENEENVVYTVSQTGEKIFKTYFEKIKSIKDKVILDEVYKLKSSFNKLETIYVAIDVVENANKFEHIIISPYSEIYNLYKSGEIDVNTFCNMAFLQVYNEGIDFEETAADEVTRNLKKSFRHSYQKKDRK